MLVGAYGTFWDRSLVDWTRHGWRLLGRQGLRRGTLQVADFRRARGVYALYGDTGIYYVGLAGGAGGIGARLKAHTEDDHSASWSRFSWFAFDEPSSQEIYPDGVLKHEAWPSVEAEDKFVIRDMEALLIAVTSPPGNIQRMKFQSGSEWHQVADSEPEVVTFERLKDKLAPRAKDLGAGHAGLC